MDWCLGMFGSLAVQGFSVGGLQVQGFERLRVLFRVAFQSC